MGLCGTEDRHCCWIGGKVCHYLTDGSDGFRWACALRKREGSWEAVYRSPEYVETVRPALTAARIDEDCGDWPGPGQECKTCGEVG